MSDAVIEASSPVGDPVPEPAPSPPSAKAADDDVAVPPLLERVEGVLGAPLETMRRHDASWGWVGPWLLVSLVGLLFGLVYLARIDVVAVQEAERERAFERMPAAQRRAIEQPETQELMATMAKFGAFMARIGLILGPAVLGLVGLVSAGGYVFVAALLQAKAGARVDLARSISLAAHAQLSNVLTYAACTVGALAGNPRPNPSPGALFDPFEHPVLGALFGRLEPGVVLYYVILVAGLMGSIGLSRRRALLVAGAAWFAATLGTLAMAGAAMSMGGGS